MGTQLALDLTSRPDPGVHRDIKPDNRSIPERFAEFHRDNPRVYQELLRLARLAKARGVRKLGVRTLWEAMRWNFLIQTDRPAGDFKLNDHYHSRFARLLNEEPDLAGLFELRELKS